MTTTNNTTEKKTKCETTKCSTTKCGKGKCKCKVRVIIYSLLALVLVLSAVIACLLKGGHHYKKHNHHQPKHHKQTLMHSEKTKNAPTTNQKQPMTNTKNQKQTDKQVENEMKAFAYNWYSMFDRKAEMTEILPFLPDETVEFVYPAKTLTNITELVAYSQETASQMKSSSHKIGEISVHKIDEDNYEIITPHTYFVERPDGTVLAMDFIGRMKVQKNLATQKDPSGKLTKVVAYKATLQGAPTQSTLENITQTKQGNTSFASAQSFVHSWFALVDAGDANALMEMVSDNNLSVDILGTSVNNKADFKTFLETQRDSQNYSVHTPTNIVITKTETGFKVSFVLNFEGEIKEAGVMKLSNITTWTLVEENGKLKLQEYSLEIL